jgi:outer membrane receptor protein involved in Fe transport
MAVAWRFDWLAVSGDHGRLVPAAARGQHPSPSATGPILRHATAVAPSSIRSPQSQEASRARGEAGDPHNPDKVGRRRSSVTPRKDNRRSSRAFRYALKAALLAGSAGLGTVVLATPATAQNRPDDAPAKIATDTPIGQTNAGTVVKDEIVVTGSRIARKDFTATSPIVTVDSNLLEKSSSINLEANLNKLPQLAPALTQFGPLTGRGDHEPTAGSTPGATTISLRQLGANRNLVLLDGRRPTPVNGTGVVDINSIPSAAIERAEIITGGASSTYGADAVGGVVNFLLKKNFQGLTIDGQFGISEHGDGREYRVSSLMGASLADGRGNVILGIERYDRKEILQFNRQWFVDLYSNPNTLGNSIFGFEQTYFLFPTQTGQAAASGTPNQTLLNSTFRNLGAPSTFPDGSNLNISAATGIYLNKDNSLFLNQGQGSGSNYTPLLIGYTGTYDGVARKKTAGGLLRDNYVDEYLSTPNNRWSFFAKGHYDLNDHISVFGQASFIESQVFTRNLVPPAITSWSVLIPHGTDIFRGDDTLTTNLNGTPIVGMTNLGIPDSVVGATPGMTQAQLALLPTNAAYTAGGKYGLNCPAVGGCTNSQVYPVPTQLAALLDSRPGANQPFQINKYLTELGERYLNNRNRTFQVIGGLNGTVPGTDWTWEVYGSHGETSTKADQYNYASVLRWRAVLNSPNYGKGFSYKANSGAPGAGFQGATGTCTSGVSPFSTAPWTADCKAAVVTNLQTENYNSQDVVETNIQGGLFKLPYGQLRFALGADYRQNYIAFHPDGQSTEGTSFFEPVNGLYPQGATTGSVSTKEIYGELLVPVLADLPFAKALNLELGYRLSNYDITTVGSVGTYKINGDYAPVEWLRFRGGYQRASRAPNLAELFTAATSTLGNNFDGDPCSRANPSSPVGIGNYSANPIGLDSELRPIANDTNGGNPDAAKVEALCRQIMDRDGSGGSAVYYVANRTYSAAVGGLAFPTLLGNPQLHQEDATTYTIGAVIRSPFQNPWLRRFNLAVDYYNVSLKNAISQQGIDGVYRRCFAKQYNPTYTMNQYCNLIGRTPGTGEVANVLITYSNAGRVETAGIDAQLNWALNFKDAGIGLPGTFSTSVQANYLLKFATTTDDGILPLIDYVGSLGSGQVGTNAGAYRLKIFSTFSYSVGPLTTSLQWQYKSAVKSQISVTDTTSNVTGAPAYNLFNLSVNVAVTSSASIRMGMDNIFNKAPPLIGVNLNADGRATLLGGTYDTGQYDVLGRRFYFGVNFKF